MARVEHFREWQRKELLAVAIRHNEGAGARVLTANKKLAPHVLGGTDGGEISVFDAWQLTTLIVA